MTSSALQGDSSSSTHPCTYHVFLSFRGKDTRTNFTAHLYQALCRNGINTFMDKEIKGGKEISTTLLEAIEKSKTSIIVFSKNYASSSWCLEELIKILDCKKEKGQEVLSLFYNVNPDEVRHQTNSIGEGLAELENWHDEMKVQSWKEALRAAANLCGKHLESRNEPDFICEIIEWVNSIIGKKTYIQAAQHPVGMQSQVQCLESLLNIEKIDRPCMVGIYGIGGIGKTAIAKEVYNSIASRFASRFVGICFLEDIRETLIKDGMIHLQNKLLSMILGDPSLKIDNVDQGITLIEQRLCRLRVLLVLDDVDSSVQLQKLAGKRDWFGLGSIIIITTRDRNLLAAHGVDSTHQYHVKELDDNKALQLFSWHAFNRDEPDSDYVEVSKDVVCYCGGLPLALIEIGSVLKGKNICFWKRKLEAYKKIPNHNIQKELRISYDGMSEDERNVFLHIACFFIGKNVDNVKQILDICGFHPYCAIIELNDKCLITESGYGSLVMHNLLQEMGREVVRQESPDEPGKRSRLWFHEDICHVLGEETGTNYVKGIVIDSPEAGLVQMSSKAFMEMKNLRLFISRKARFSGKLHSLPNELRFLYWPEYTEESLPSNFRGRNLSVLRMPHSCLKELNGIETFQNLTIMNLSNCKFLKEVPDVSRISKLTRLILDGCVSLVTIHHSVGFLHELIYLSLENCNKLTSFLESIEFRLLETLVLCGCSSLQNFPQINCRMECLKNIDLQYTGIEKLPSSIGHLVGVKQLFLTGCTNLTNLPDSIDHLQNLECLILNGCTSIKGLPSSIGGLLRVKTLDLSGCTNLTNLPNSIYQLHHLEQLDLDGCSKVVKFPDNIQSFPKLRQLNLRNCSLSESNFFRTFDCCSALNCLDLSGSSIVTLPPYIKRFVGLKFLYLNECKGLQKILGLPPNVEEVSAWGCVSLAMLLDPLELVRSGTMFPAQQSSSLGNSVATELEDCLLCLEDLDLSSSAIVSLPIWIDKFVGLERLTLEDCKQLREISELPPNIRAVYAHGCTSLKRFQSNNIYDLPTLGWIDLSNCHELHENMGNDLYLRLLSEERPEDHKFVCIFPGTKIPDWFSHSKKVLNSNSCKIDINEPAHLDAEITRIAFSAVIGTKANIPDVQDEIIKGGQDEDAYGIIFKVINDGVEIYSFMEDNIPGQFHSDHVWFHYNVPESFNLKGDNLQVKFKLRSASMFFKSCGFHLVRRNEEKAVDLMDGVQLSKRRRDDDDDDGNLGSNRYPQQKRQSSTLGIRISEAEDTPLSE